MTYILSMFNTGQVTLPKKWRSQFNTTKFVATEQDGKLIVEPLEKEYPGLEDENVEVYDSGEGIRFKKGVDAGVLIECMKDHFPDLRDA